VPIGAGWRYEIKFDGYRCGIMAQTPQEVNRPALDLSRYAQSF
jgi:ATP-dependent DNA ligase